MLDSVYECLCTFYDWKQLFLHNHCVTPLTMSYEPHEVTFHPCPVSVVNSVGLPGLGPACNMRVWGFCMKFSSRAT